VARNTPRYRLSFKDDDLTWQVPGQACRCA